MFSCEFCEISKNTFSYRTPPVVASEKRFHQQYHFCFHLESCFQETLIVKYLSHSTFIIIYYVLPLSTTIYCLLLPVSKYTIRIPFSHLLVFTQSSPQILIKNLWLIYWIFGWSNLVTYAESETSGVFRTSEVEWFCEKS